ncbi:MAG: Glu/Leu/Phe/Val dehydrogenase dimerization domain-containing protein [Actinomycetota bacterium]
MIEDLLRDWDGEHLSARFDRPTGAWLLVGVHSTRLGPGMGGTRMKVYDSLERAIDDVLRLSSAMTAKNALAGLPFGGGKAVLAVPSLPSGAQRRKLLERYGDLVCSLGGSYVTACDMNTTPEDMDVVAERNAHTLGRSLGNGGSGSSAPATAVGVFHGIRAGLEHALGSPDLSGRRVLVQGVGAVGEHLAELLGAEGAELLLSDVRADRAGIVADRIGGKVVASEEALSTPCDVFSPCATGGILDARTVETLRCMVVAGAANNQLDAPDLAGRLRARGVLYAPDYVVNAGGVLSLAGREVLGWSEGVLAARLERIGDTVREVFAISERDGSTTDEAAASLVAALLV